MRLSTTAGLTLCLLFMAPSVSLANDYALSSGRYSAADDLFAAVWNEFHVDEPGAAVADWQDIRDTCDDAAACSRLVDVVGREAPLVLRDGKAFCPSGQYFVFCPDGPPPRRYHAIDQIASHGLWLLCGPIDAPVLARLRGRGEPAGVVAPDLQLYLSNLQLFAPRLRREIWAHLEFYGFGPNGEFLWSLRDFGDISDNGKE